MDTKAFNEKNFDKSRAVCEGIEREDGDGRVVLTDREREILDMWPRFEDTGEPVWFGDEVEMQDEIVREVWTFTLDVNAKGDKRLYLNGFEGLFMLPGEPVKHPAPKVLDADGVEIKVGDTVWFKGNPRPYAVVEVKDGSVRLYSKTHCSEESATTVFTDILTHIAPDSWERLEEDAAKDECDYFGAEDGDNCHKCPASGGKLSCWALKSLDLVRRAKALVGVEE